MLFSWLNPSRLEITDFIPIKSCIWICFKAVKIMFGLNDMRASIAHPADSWIIVGQGNTICLFLT